MVGIFENPYLHKIIGHFNSEIHATLSFEKTSTYLFNRHGLSDSKLAHTNVQALWHHIESMPIHTRASTIKLIHGWMPTYAILSRQGRSETPLCPCCNTRVETSPHVFTCQETQAITQRISHLTTFLSALHKLKTPIQLMATLEYKLSITLQIPYTQTYQTTSISSSSHQYALLTAIRHKNILGWDNFLCGFITTYWAEYLQLTNPTILATWEITLIKLIFMLITAIWKDRNKILHRDTRKEANELLREHTIKQVEALYQHPPLLHKCFWPFTSITLQDRLSRSTTHLLHWLDRIKHQIKVSQHMKQLTPHNQLTIPQALRRAQVLEDTPAKYPP